MIYLVYSTLGKTRFFHGTFESEREAISAATSRALAFDPDTVYVKQFGVGTIWHSKRPPDDGYLVRPKLVVVGGTDRPDARNSPEAIAVLRRRRGSLD
jgi:hypothetical protein